ncbi:MAG TPA: ATP-dependent DNA ligase [Blastocatellia bacterium]|nr:ATP-dependent DNA ligase [Blastocatellia bacterium]
MRFQEFTKYLDSLENTSGRIEMYRILGELFQKADPAETAQIAYLCEGRLLPAFEGLETGMGERTIAVSIASAARRTEEEVALASQKLGDLGLVAESLSPRSKRGSLGVSDVYEALLRIARTTGKGSTESKQAQLSSLIKLATPLEARYIVRLTQGRLRLGIAAPTIIEAVARTQENPKEARRIIERAFNLCSDIGLALATLRERGLGALASFKVRVGNPVRPMLAERLPGAEQIIQKIGRCAVEPKLDGFRCQVHLKNGRVEMFSRNLEPMTEMFPDIADAIRDQISAKSAIIDGEALALNEETGEFYPFQVTVQRKRKHKISEMAEEFPLVLVAFDLLYANGKDLTQATYEQRRAGLQRITRPRRAGRVRISEAILTERAEELQSFFDEEVSQGHEGVVAKRLSAGYEPGARNYNWIKLKRAYRGELSDTVDVVLIGYLRGRGARARLGIGSLLGAVYDPRDDSFQSVGKIGSGLSDENWIRLRELLDEIKVDAKPARVNSRMTPDVWIDPEIVVTVLADEITRSPVHTAGSDEHGRGLALRFPRVVGFVRDDKSAEDATTTREIEKMFAQQRGPKKGEAPADA